MTHMMIDFETLAVSRNAAVASLGWAVFDDEAVHDSGGWVINVASSILAGGVVDPDTVGWWQTQSAEAQAAITSGGVSILETMNGLAEVWEKKDCEFIWSHGATFDIPIAEFYFEGNEPWKYSRHRDTRTLFDIATRKGWVRRDNETAHIAQADAVDQAVDVVQALRHLRGL